MVFFIMRLQNPIPFLFCCVELFISSNSNLLRLFYFFTLRLIPIFIFKVHLCPSHFPFCRCQPKFEMFLFTGFHRFRFLHSVGFPTGSNNAWKHAIQNNGFILVTLGRCNLLGFIVLRSFHVISKRLGLFIYLFSFPVLTLNFWLISINLPSLSLHGNLVSYLLFES